jgi:hypothetical protein
MNRALRYNAATGHLLRSGGGHLLNAATFACNGEPMSLLTLTGFDDTTPCQTCDEACAAEHQPWAGTLMPTAACVWSGRNANGFGGSANEHLIVNDQPFTSITLSWHSPLAVWRIELLGDGIVVWDGYGPPNASPIGTYYQTTGCWTQTQLAVTA